MSNSTRTEPNTENTEKIKNTEKYEEFISWIEKQEENEFKITDIAYLNKQSLVWKGLIQYMVQILRKGYFQ